MLKLDPETQQLAADLFDRASTILDERFGPYPSEDIAAGREQLTLSGLLLIRESKALEVRIMDDETQEDTGSGLTASGADFDHEGRLTGASMIVVPADETEEHLYKPLTGRQLKGFLGMLLRTLNDEASIA